MNKNPMPKKIQLGTYRHNKTNNLYEVVGVALHSETDEHLVIYRPLYDSNYVFFARPYDRFIEAVELSGEIKPRFEQVDD